MLDALDESGGAGVGATHGSLHTAYSTTGANEVSGGSPAYARKAATWAPPAGRAKATSSSMVFDVPSGATIRWCGFFDASTSGAFLGMTPNGGGIPEAFAVPEIANDTLEAPSHGFTTGDSVVVWAVPGAPLPSPLAEGTVYYVIAATAADLKLSLTSGGSPVSMASVGSGFLQRLVQEVFGAQGTHTVTSATMTLD
jgi:hypothetical protein